MNKENTENKKVIEKIIEDAKEGNVKSKENKAISTDDKEVLHDTIDGKIGPLSTGVACG